ncbi:hypothetical protein JCM10908_006154 [Rhodotorula pacifica]|uniref:uncharacterized protein n=1 Tax=Rhodotorula pacifica TaxID=1495444 RepID=UPI00316E4E97
MAESLAVPASKPPTTSLTPQEIELKLGSPSLAGPGALQTAYSAEGEPSLLERRASNTARRPSHSSAVTTGTEGTEDEALHASPHPRANLPLSAISETEDALGSGSDVESDASSLGGGGDGGPRSPRLVHADPRPPLFGQNAPGAASVEPIRTSRDSAGLSENVTLKSGYLMKKGERRKAWKKRWFVLRGGQLAMYKTEKEYRLLRLIPLFDIHAVAPVELKKHTNAFGIVTPRRTYYVKADSSAEVKSWCQQIEAAKAEYAARATRVSLDTPTGTEHPTPVSGTPIPSPRHIIASPTSDQATSPLGAPAAYGQGIAIPGTSAPQTSGSYAPASYATTASSSYGGHPATLGTSYASTASSSLGGVGSAPSAHAGSRAPPNSLVTPAPVAFHHEQQQQQQSAGLGLHSPHAPGMVGGLDARLEQLNLDGNGGLNAGGLGTGPTPAGLQRDTSRRSDTSPAGRAVVSSGLVGGVSSRGRSSSNATGTSSHLASTTTGGGAVSSSDEEEANEPGYDYPMFTSGLVAPTTLGQSTAPAATATSSALSPPAAQQSTTALADPNKVILSGYLMKQGKRKTWRKRWFVLTSGMLMYSRSHMDQKFNRQIPLTSVLDAIEYEAPSPSSPLAQKRSSVAAHPGATSPHGGATLGVGGGVGGASSGGDSRGLEHAFKIITPKRTYLVCAPSEEDEIKWLAALQCLVARRNQLHAGPTSPPPLAGGALPPAVPSLNTAATTTTATSDAPARRPSQTGPPPVTRPLHGRNRSVTDAARQAVRDVELRFQGGTLRAATVAPPPGAAAGAGTGQPVA